MAKAKTRAKKKPAPSSAAPPSAGEQLAAARRNLRNLRELKAVMRQCRNAVNALEVDQVNLARLLVSTTEFTVVDVNELGRLSARVNTLVADNLQLSNELRARDRELNPEPV